MTAAAYDVTWAPSTQRDPRRLPEKVSTAVIEFADASLANNPRCVGRALHLDLGGQRAARRGDYRVIYSIDEAARAIRIVAVDHRSDVYRPR